MGQSIPCIIFSLKENYSNNDLSRYLAHIETLVINLEILPLDKIIFNKIRITMYNYTNDMLPSVMHELYKKNNEVHTYGTRNKELFRIDRGQKD